MEYRKLGRTGVDISLVGLGTMNFGEQNTEAEAHQQMDRALEAGINLFDAAEMYPVPPKPETQGRTEQFIGSWLKARPGAREKIVLATKVLGRSPNTWLRDGEKPTKLDWANIEEACNKSLKRLGVEIIDLYQVHFPDRPVPQFGSNPVIYRHVEGEAIPIEETLRALENLVKAGKVRHLGLSNENPWGLMNYLKLSETAGLPRIASIQNAYSLVNRTFETGLADIAMREQVPLLAYSALAQGYLTGKYRNGALPPRARKTLFNRLQRYETPGADAAFEAYFQLAGELGVSCTQLALKFALTRPFMGSVLIGATTMAQLDECIAAQDLPWNDEVEAKVNAVHLMHTNPCP